jgi:XTP/dITP diphosphohydrolase
VLVYVRHADDPQPVIADGVWRGQIVDTPRGANGFGYDPYFLIPAWARPPPSWSQREERLSHRGQALRALVEKLK